jgi:hypothetical protein
VRSLSVHSAVRILKPNFTCLRNPLPGPKGNYQPDNDCWIHGTRGFLTKTCTEVASLSYYASGRLIHSWPDGNHRIRQVIKALHKLTTEIWAGHNMALHQASALTPEPLSLIDAKIVRYELLLLDDRFYCENSLHRLLASGASIKRRWLHRVKRSQEKRRHLKKINLGLQNMSTLTIGKSNHNQFLIRDGHPMLKPQQAPTHPQQHDLPQFNAS